MDNSVKEIVLDIKRRRVADQPTTISSCEHHQRYRGFNKSSKDLETI